MITLLVTCVIINFLKKGLVNDTFINFKLIVFINTGFICSNKEVLLVVLINHRWIFPTFPKVMGVGNFVYSPKNNGSG